MKITASITYYYFFCFLLVILLISAKAIAEEGNGNAEQPAEVKKSDFPDGFLFGVSTSSYQIEGAILDDDKSLSNWDVFVRKRGSVNNGDTADIAADHYHRYLEDIEIIHSLGVDAYRFSISWARILPRGKLGDVNPAGIMFYNKIIDNLLIRGIKPFVTIHHYDFPQELLDRYGGWLSPFMQDDYVHFAETCFKYFGDRVRYWITMNEANLLSELAYEKGIYPPGRCSPPFGNCSAGNSDIEPLIAMHNMLLAHSKAVKLYREQFQHKQGGMMGVAVSAMMYEPLSDDELDKEAANRALAFSLAWGLDPLVYGDYPPEMRRYHGKELPTFTSEEKQLLSNSTDFIGLNHYATVYAKDCIYSNCMCSNTTCLPGENRAIKGFVSTITERDGVPIGEPTGMFQTFIVPRGIKEIVDYAKKRYPDKPVFIVENGYCPPWEHGEVDDLQHDTKRVEYHKAYIASLAQAIRDGADVRGYFIWTLMDAFEWSSGYDLKFGLYSLDRVTLNRIPRLSAKWYRDFLRKTSLKDLESRSAIPAINQDGLVPNVKDGSAEMA
ncbi:beta-glucosidase 18-like [Coffea arabica]|uniref:Beta-glucosidase 18-like n=1 Tax=Coffea arabica TaxID=13443 RepID=A0ABM4UDF5_COFAR|nr:beta-glucosidase 18-like isoform X1 [Coffea arabica]